MENSININMTHKFEGKNFTEWKKHIQHVLVLNSLEEALQQIEELININVTHKFDGMNFTEWEEYILECACT